MANQRRSYRFHLHREHFLRHVNPKITRGLEIGAFDLPMIESEEGNCEFADFRSTAELKELAGQLKGYQPDYVVPIRYNLKQGYEAITERFDWIAAAHVIEHIPDVIGWLKVLASKLVDGGILFLIVPDKRFTFDYYRRETTVSDLVDTHRSQLTKPSFAQVFDHHFYATEAFDPAIVWAGGIAPAPKCNYSATMELSMRSEHEYIDSHCSVFSPESFSRIFFNLEKAGAVPFKIGEVRSTQANQSDFSVIFNKADINSGT